MSLNKTVLDIKKSQEFEITGFRTNRLAPGHFSLQLGNEVNTKSMLWQKRKYILTVVELFIILEVTSVTNV